MFDSCDQLPFRPHSDAVGREEGVEDLERQRRGQFEVLKREADGTGALADHADVRRCSEEFEKARARVLEFAELIKTAIRIARVGPMVIGLPVRQHRVLDVAAREGVAGLAVVVDEAILDHSQGHRERVVQRDHGVIDVRDGVLVVHVEDLLRHLEPGYADERLPFLVGVLPLAEASP